MKKVVAAQSDVRERASLSGQLQEIGLMRRRFQSGTHPRECHPASRRAVSLQVLSERLPLCSILSCQQGRLLF